MRITDPIEGIKQIVECIVFQFNIFCIFLIFYARRIDHFEEILRLDPPREVEDNEPSNLTFIIFILQVAIMGHGAIFAFHLVASLIESTVSKDKQKENFNGTSLVFGSMFRIAAIIAYVSVQFYLCAEYPAIKFEFRKYKEVNIARDLVMVDIRLLMCLVTSGVIFLFLYLVCLKP